MSVTWRGVDAGLHDGYVALAQVVQQAGGVLVLTSPLRSQGEQSRLYQRYINGQSGGLPAAPPYHSAHEYGWAFDAVCNPREWQSDVGAVWTQWGGVYGADRDPVHFELPGAGATAYSLGEQTAPVAEGAGTAPRNQNISGIGLLPSRWKNYIYTAEDIGLGFVPQVAAVQMVASLLKAGYPDSEILTVIQSPVEELHKLFPWIPF